MKNFMAIDQYGQAYHNLGPYPRRALLQRFGKKHADKMYRDKPSGESVHVGYVIAKRWLTLFEVIPVENKL